MKYVLLLALLGCSKAKEPPPPTPASGSAPAVIADAAVPPPYTPAGDVPQPIKDAIAAPDRSVEDRMLDAGRKPGELLAFFGVAPGQKIGELFAGGGTTTELVARVTGTTVYAQNAKEILDRFARKPWTERAAKPVMSKVIAFERPIDDPFPADVKNLDAVLCILNYHDTVWMKADRAKLNKAVFAALRPGGIFGIVDHSAKAGAGTTVAESLHRIEQKVVVDEITAAGFKLDGESDLLRNAADPRDWNSSPREAGERRGSSDRFVLRFKKP
jgi:predicted methyltransferase